MSLQIENDDVKIETEISEVKYYTHIVKQNIVTINLKINPSSPTHSLF
jgi:hypothetical protein